MILDFTGLALTLYLFYCGYKKGIIVAAFSFTGLLFGLFCSLKLSSALAGWLLEKDYVSPSWTLLVSYLILFFGMVWLFRFAALLVEKLLKTVKLSLVNKCIGGILYAFMGCMIWSTCLWLANKLHLISPETIVSSYTFNYYTPIAPYIFERIGDWLPFVKNTFNELQLFFDQLNQKLPNHVGAYQ